MLALIRYICIRNILTHRLRSSLNVAGIALGVSIIVAIGMVNRTIFDSFSESVDMIAGKAVLSIMNGQAGFGEEILEKVLRTRGVKKASPLILNSVIVKGTKGERLQVFGVDFLEDRGIRDYEISDENMEMEDPIVVLSQPDSIFVTERFAKRNSLGLNSRIMVRTSSGENMLTVRGVMKEKGPARAFGGTVALMDVYAAQRLFKRDGLFDQVDVVIQPGEDVDDVKRRLEESVRGFAMVDSPQGRTEQIESLLSAMRFALLESSLLAVVVGIFLIYNTMSVAVVQRRREIGIIRSLGVTSGSVRNLFLLESSMVGATGSIIGTVGGIFLARLLLPFLDDVLNAFIVTTGVEGLRPAPGSIALGITCGIGASFLAALIPAMQSARVVPIEVMRKDAPKRANPGTARRLAMVGLAFIVISPVCLLFHGIQRSYLLGLAFPVTHLVGVALLIPQIVFLSTKTLRRLLGWLFGINGRLSGDNLVSAPWRTSVTIMAVMVGTAAVMVIGNTMKSIKISLDTWIDVTIASDLSITSSARIAGPQSSRLPGELIEEIEKIEGVEFARSFRYILILYEGEMTYLEAFDLNKLLERGRYIMIKGGQDELAAGMLRGDAVAVSDAFAIHYGKTVGDTITLNTPTGEREFKILGEVVDYAGRTGAIHIDREFYMRYWKDPLLDEIEVALKRTASADAVISTIRERFGERYDLQILTLQEFKDEISGSLTRPFRLSTVTEIIVILISALGVINTLLAAILDRHREIGILRAVGATRTQIINSVLIEAVLLGGIGTLFGVAAGMSISFEVVRSIILRVLGYHLDYHIALGTMLGAFIVAILVSIAAGLYPARKASRVNILEAIGYE